MGMIDYPSSGRVKAEDILFPMDHAYMKLNPGRFRSSRS